MLPLTDRRPVSIRRVSLLLAIGLLAGVALTRPGWWVLQRVLRPDPLLPAWQLDVLHDGCVRVAWMGTLQRSFPDMLVDADHPAETRPSPTPDLVAQRLGRLSLNPVVHVDVIGTIVFPLVAIASGVPLIGWAKPVPVDFRHLQSPRRDFAIIAAAGPASNIAMAAVGAAVFESLGGNSAYWSGDLVAGTVRYFVLLNVLLAVFNMIPIPPLDGGNVLMGVLPPAGAALVDRVRPYGFLLLYLMMFSGVLSAIVRPVQRFVQDWLL